MVKIKYIEHDNTAHVRDVEAGVSVMQGAIKSGVPGIAADCGGAGACATCHVYIEESWAEKVGARAPIEDEMLRFAVEPQHNSRLSCQIMVREELDGLVVRLPKSQYF